MDGGVSTSGTYLWQISPVLLVDGTGSFVVFLVLDAGPGLRFSRFGGEFVSFFGGVFPCVTDLVWCPLLCGDGATEKITSCSDSPLLSTGIR